MKKLFSLFFSVLMLGFSAFAQEDKGLFNHLSVGATVGLDGLGIEVSAPITRYVQLRAGYSLFVPTKVTSIYNFGSFTVSSARKLDMTRVPISATPLEGGQGKLIADIYPWPSLPFHFAAGLFIGSGKMFDLSMDAREILTPDEYGHLAFSHNGVFISSDMDGFVKMDVMTNPVMPYVGIGFGHAVNTRHLVSVTFDMGVLVTSVKTQSYNYLRNNDGEPVIITSHVVDDRDRGLLDFLNKLPVLPMIKLNVFFNIF